MKPAAAAMLPKNSSLRSFEPLRFGGSPLTSATLAAASIAGGPRDPAALAAPAAAAVFALGMATSRVASAISEASTLPSAIRGAALVLVSLARSLAPAAASLLRSRTCSAHLCHGVLDDRGGPRRPRRSPESTARSTQRLLLAQAHWERLPLLDWLLSIMPHLPSSGRAPLGVGGTSPRLSALLGIARWGGMAGSGAHLDVPDPLFLGKADMADLQAVLKTNQGDIAIHLFPDHAPKTVDNFVGLAEGTKDYDDRRRPDAAGVLRRARLPPGHRRLHDPGRLPARHRHRRPGLPFKDEIHPELQCDRTCWRWRTPAAAPTARSSSSPPADAWLNRKHTIFGEVADEYSREVVDAIATSQTGRATVRTSYRDQGVKIERR